mmetsp:Transcript_7227/g.19679  ORF Transcript_7227/g.19679 Transcript_7227/m.19679 type:complete len:228 (-) Transcript_7227:936-1619(-)
MLSPGSRSRPRSWVWSCTRATGRWSFCTTTMAPLWARPPTMWVWRRMALPRTPSSVAWSYARAPRSSPRAATAPSPRRLSLSSTCARDAASRRTASGSRRCGGSRPRSTSQAAWSTRWAGLWTKTRGGAPSSTTSTTRATRSWPVAMWLGLTTPTPTSAPSRSSSAGRPIPPSSPHSRAASDSPTVRERSTRAGTRAFPSSPFRVERSSAAPLVSSTCPRSRARTRP